MARDAYAYVYMEMYTLLIAYHKIMEIFFASFAFFAGVEDSGAIVIYDDSDIVCVENIFALHFSLLLRQFMPFGCESVHILHDDIRCVIFTSYTFSVCE